MSEIAEKVYSPASLDEYTLRQRISIRLAELVFFLSIKLIGSTIRFETDGIEHLANIENAGKIPIYTFWHDRIFLGTYFFRNRGIVVMTSRSFDGEYIARFIQRLGYGSIRGSSSRSGSRALIEMIKGMRRGLPMAFAIDGPRGPRYRVKPGVALLAKKTGNPILPFILQPKSYFELKSWDRMQIPRPFTRAVVVIGEPIYVDADASEAEMEAKLSELQQSLDALVERGHRHYSSGDT